MPAAFNTQNALASGDVSLSPNTPIKVLCEMNGQPTEMIERYAEAEALSQKAVAEINQRNAEHDRIREQYENAISRRNNLIESHRRHAATVPTKELDALNREIEMHLGQLRNPSSAGRKIMSQPVDEAERLIRNHRGVFVIAEIPAVDPLDTDEATLAEATGTVDSLFKTLAKTEQRARTKAVIKERVAAELDMLASAGKPGLEDIANPVDLNGRTGRFQAAVNDGGIRWPMQYVRPGSDDDGQMVNTRALFVWLNHDAIQEKLFAEIDARKSEGITVEDKIAKVKELHGQIARALRYENEVLRVLESRGNYSLRKRKYHPAVILGVEWDDSKIAEYANI